MTLTDQQRRKIEAFIETIPTAHFRPVAFNLAEHILAHLSEFLPEDISEDFLSGMVMEYYNSSTIVKSDNGYYDGLMNSPYRAMYEAMKQERETQWIKYSEKKPEVGQLVSIFRDIEAKQIYTKQWSEEDEIWADMNEITHWKPEQYPAI